MLNRVHLALYQYWASYMSFEHFKYISVAMEEVCRFVITAILVLFFNIKVQGIITSGKRLIHILTIGDPPLLSFKWRVITI